MNAIENRYFSVQHGPAPAQLQRAGVRHAYDHVVVPASRLVVGAGGREFDIVAGRGVASRARNQYLRLGTHADIAVLEEREGRFVFTNSMGAGRVGSGCRRAVVTVRRGQIVPGSGGWYPHRQEVSS